MAIGKNTRRFAVKSAARPQHTGQPTINSADPDIITHALKGTQKRFDTFAETHDSIHDPYAWNNELVWSNGVQNLSWPDDIETSPRNKVLAALQSFLKSYQAKDHDLFAFSDCLCIWDISSLCSKERFFRFPEIGFAFCIQFSDSTPYVVKIALVNGELGVYLKQDVYIPISEFVETLRQHSPGVAPGYDIQHKFWESRVSQGKEKFNFSGLPYELRWLIIEQFGQDTDLWPFLYKRGDARSRYSDPSEVRRFGAMTIALEQYKYAMPGLGIFEMGSSDQDMLIKMSIRRNTFCFDRPGHLARFLDSVGKDQLREIRNIHLNLSHDDFLSLFGANVQPGHQHGRFTEALKMLGQLNLNTVWIEPKVSEDMIISSYFSTPQAFGCHSKAVKHICGLITRNLQNAKKLRLCGFHVRRGWQAPLDDMFFDAKRAEFTSDSFYALRAARPPRVDEEELDGGVRVSEKRRQPNDEITRAAEQRAHYDAAVDLPPVDEEALGLLWPCNCHEQCGPDRFNSRDPPRKKKEKKHGEAQQTGEPAEAGILGEQVQLTDALPLDLVQNAVGSGAGQDDDGDVAPEQTADNGAEWWIE